MGDVLGRRVGSRKSTVGREQPGLELLGQLDVETVDQTQVVTTPPGSGDEGWQQMSYERRVGQPPQPHAGLTRGEQAAPLQPAERREDLRIEVCRNVHLTASKSPLDV